MKLFCLSALTITGILAVASLVAIPLWLIGVPGVQNQYAKGWKIGLYGVALYPLVWLGIFRYWWTARNTNDLAHQAEVNLWAGSLALTVLALASAVMLYAFRVMSRK